MPLATLFTLATLHCYHHIYTTWQPQCIVCFLNFTIILHVCLLYLRHYLATLSGQLLLVMYGCDSKCPSPALTSVATNLAMYGLVSAQKRETQSPVMMPTAAAADAATDTGDADATVNATADVTATANTYYGTMLQQPVLHTQCTSMPHMLLMLQLHLLIMIHIQPALMAKLSRCYCCTRQCWSQLQCLLR